MVRSKNNLKQYKYVCGLSLKVISISAVLVLARPHILFFLKEKKETYHRRTLFSLMRIKVKRNYHKKRPLKLVTDN